jgi:hypothetical protein
MIQVVECLPSKLEALSSISRTIKKSYKKSLCGKDSLLKDIEKYWHDDSSHVSRIGREWTWGLRSVSKSLKVLLEQEEARLTDGVWWLILIMTNKNKSLNFFTCILFGCSLSRKMFFRRKFVGKNISWRIQWKIWGERRRWAQCLRLTDGNKFLRNQTGRPEPDKCS